MACHFEHDAAAGDPAGAFHIDGDRGSQLYHAIHRVCPAFDRPGVALRVARFDGVLRRGGKPHAVHEGRCKPGDRSGAAGCVDGVEVAGRAGERRHVRRGGDRDAAQQAARGVAHIRVDAAVCGCVDGQLGAVGSTADGEAFDLLGDDGAVLGRVRHMDRDDAPGCGFRIVLRPCGDVDGLAGVSRERITVVGELDEMVEVHCVEQAFDDRGVAVVHGAQRGVDRRPCGSHERIGHDARFGKLGRQGCACHRLVVGAEVGGQRVVRLHMAERMALFPVGVVRNDLGHCVEHIAGDGGVADSGGGCKHRIHVLGQARLVDDRHQVRRAGVEVQRDHDVAHGVLAGAAVRFAIPMGVQVHVKVPLRYGSIGVSGFGIA